MTESGKFLDSSGVRMAVGETVVFGRLERCRGGESRTHVWRKQAVAATISVPRQFLYSKGKKGDLSASSQN
jgi:hypothetical protein